jgi:hypothetical protein
MPSKHANTYGYAKGVDGCLQIFPGQPTGGARERRVDNAGTEIEPLRIRFDIKEFSKPL